MQSKVPIVGYTVFSPLFKLDPYAFQEFFLNILGATATKREAKSYLSRFQPGSEVKRGPKAITVESRAAGFTIPGEAVNLGDLYLPVRSIDNSPVFSLASKTEPMIDRSTEPTHVALVVLRSSESLSEKTLQDVARTLSQLSQLGLHSVVVLEACSRGYAPGSEPIDPYWRRDTLAEVDRVATAIGDFTRQQVRRLDGILYSKPVDTAVNLAAKVIGEMRISNSNLLLSPLRRNIIPVIAPICSSIEQKLVPAKANEIALAITREFAGIASNQSARTDVLREQPDASEVASKAAKPVSLDRIIILDPQGGIPPSGVSNRAHVFINLEQEYEEIQRDLDNLENGDMEARSHIASTTKNDSQTRQSTTIDYRPNKSIPNHSNITSASQTHKSNLQLTRDALALLPPTSSALITSPQAVTDSSFTHHSPSSTTAPGVGTRPQRNILIHNLLTDKPLYSSSLPTSRLSSSSTHPNPSTFPVSTLPTTFLKRGMPLTILPDPRLSPWLPPPPG